MSDLISRSELYDKLGDKLTWLMRYGDDVYLDVGSDIKDVIYNMPTAYDIDKVVEELKNASWEETDISTVIYIDDAIEIVKQGGVSDDVFVSDKYKRETGCEYTFYDLHHAVPFKYCPYCGKKIKVVDR